MRVLSKQRITISAAIKISGKGGNDPHSCSWNFNCDNYVSSGFSYANYPTAWCNILFDNSVTHVGTISAPLTKHKKTLPRHSSSPLVPVVWQANSACRRRIQHPQDLFHYPAKAMVSQMVSSFKFTIVSYLSPVCYIPSQCFPNSVFLHAD
jgi:hypothetical protein